MSPWFRYSLIRLGIFGAVFTLLYLLGFKWWVALIFATIISFTAGYVFFQKTRDELAANLRERRERKSAPVDPDAAAEDVD